MNFGIKLKNLRHERQLTQAQLAKQLGIAVSAISSYESGARYPSYEILIGIARIFHVSTDYLLGLSQTRTIDVSDLDEEDLTAITQIINVLRRKNYRLHSDQKH